MRDFLLSQFDKILLSTMIFVLLGVGVHSIHHNLDAGILEWIKGLTSGFSGALLTLITGRALSRKADNGEKNDIQRAIQQRP